MLDPEQQPCRSCRQSSRLRAEEAVYLVDEGLQIRSLLVAGAQIPEPFVCGMRQLLSLTPENWI
jgi:hypothetical protein